MTNDTYARGPRRVLQLAGLVALVGAVMLLAAGLWPMPASNLRVAYYPQDMQLRGTQAALLENRSLVTVWPRRVWAGEVATIRVRFEPDPMAGELFETGLTDISNEYQVALVGRPELAGVEIAPRGEVQEALHTGQTVELVWQMRASQTGAYPGTLWLHLRFTPRDGSQAIDQVLAAQQIEIQAITWLGMSQQALRLVGGLGMAISLVLLTGAVKTKR